MLKHFFFVALCGLPLSACVPGPELDRPAVEGRVYDAQTLRPVAGARITVARAAGDLPERELPDTLSDAQGHFSLTARYKLGIVLLYGDPKVARVTVRISREGYQSLDLRETYNFYVGPFQPLHEEAALEPSSTSASAKQR